MIRALLYIYAGSHLVAFLSLRHTYFWAFRYYVLAATVQGIISLFPWGRTAWWSQCWIYTEPFMLVWRALTLAELGYYATTRLYAEERMQLFKVASCSGGIVLLVALFGIWKHSMFAREIAVMTAVETTLAVMALTGCWYFWRRPVECSAITTRHGCLLTALLAFKAMVDLTWPTIRDTEPVYWVINGCYLAAVSALMMTWAWLGGQYERYTGIIV